VTGSWTKDFGKFWFSSVFLKREKPHKNGKRKIKEK
jgi:hypothetical protein